MRDRKRVFEQAFTAYADELFRHALYHISDRERALDLMQETYLRSYRYAKHEDIGHLRGFLYRTLRHLIIDEYRKKKSVSLDTMLSEEGSTIEHRLPQDETNTLEAAMERLDGAAALQRLADLPPQYREVLLLRYVDELSVQEIAERIGVSENLASVRIHRALKALKSLLTTT